MINIKKIKVVGYIATIISFIFIINTFLSMDIDVSFLNNPNKIGIIIFLLALLLSLSYYFAGYAWKLILQFCAAKSINTRFVIDIYIRTNIVKYIPGNFMQFAGRNLLGSSLEISQVNILTSTIIEILLLVITALILVLILAANNLKRIFYIILKNDSYLIILITVVIVALVIFLGIVGFLLHRKKLDSIKRLFSKKFLITLSKILPIYIWNHAVNVFIFICIFRYILNVDIDIQLLASTCLLSWVIGYIIPGAPGGIGIREMILMVLLKDMYNENIVAMAPIFFRVIGIISDVLAYLNNILINKIYKKYTSR